MSEPVKIKVESVEQDADVFEAKRVFVCRFSVPDRDRRALVLLPGMLASGELTLAVPVEIESVEARLARATSDELLAEVKRRMGHERVSM